MKKSEMFARGAQAAASLLPPLGLGYIAAFLREHGHLCEIYDGIAQPVGLQALCEHALNFDILGISVTTAYYLRAAEFLNMLQHYAKRPPVLVGGPHATSLPETLLASGADVAVLGEGEYASLELVKTLAGRRRPFLDKSALLGIAGIAFIDGNSGAVVKTKRRRPISDLDVIPLPARDLLPMRLYGTSIARSTATPSHSMMTSRGCTGACSFCNHALFGRSIRRFSPARVVEEFFVLRDAYKAKSVAVFDDNFLEDAVYAKAVLELLIAGKFRLPIS
ncbi:MAG: B12-binding domain-containing radical SAM protein, partial [Deltaproteobacteria bacterium]|nr:B12-binding domain-containing radical SAM protein [Deltaproteobacteria bacterium]